MLRKMNCRIFQNKMIRIFLFGVLILYSISNLFSMPQQESPEKDDSFTVTDMRGRSVAVPGKIENIIALDAGSLRLVSYLDATDRITAVEDSGHGREKQDPYMSR